MANPQKENGYTKIANEILEALARTRISGESRQCLDVILRKTYGFNKKEDQISLTQFAKLTSIRHRRNVLRGLKTLSDMNIITVVKNDNAFANKYRFNKDYHQWKSVVKIERGVVKKGKGVVKIATKSVVKIATYKRKKETIQKKGGVFKPPTTDEVKNYCKEKGYTFIDSDLFIDHYETTGWMRGKNKIKDWKACIRTWVKREKEKPTGRVIPKTPKTIIPVRPVFTKEEEEERAKAMAELKSKLGGKS